MLHRHGQLSDKEGLLMRERALLATRQQQQERVMIWDFVSVPVCCDCVPVAALFFVHNVTLDARM